MARRKRDNLIDMPSIEMPELDMPSLDMPNMDAVGRDAEAESQGEMSEALKSFKAKARVEEERLRDATDGEYWVCLTFQSKEERDAWFQRVGCRLDDQYADGRELAKAVGFPITTPAPRERGVRIDREWEKLT